MSSEIRIGLIGCGVAAQFFHAPAYGLMLQGQAKIRIVALADPNRSNRELIARFFPDVREYDSFEAMLKKENLDVVDIMLPHHLYVDVVPVAARYCENVLVEKPFARTRQEADIILSATSQCNFSVVHNYLYGRRYKNALEVIASGMVGTPFLVRLENFNTGMGSIDESLKSKWKTVSTLSGGGAFHNHGYHLVYLARALMGSEVTSVSAAMGNYYQGGDILDTAVVTLSHKNGGISVLLDGWLNNQKTAEIEEVLCTKGTLSIPLNSDPIKKFKTDLNNPDLPRHDVLKTSPYARSMAACISSFIDAVRTGSRPPVTAEEAYKNLIITLAAYEAHISKHTVAVS